MTMLTKTRGTALLAAALLASASIAWARSAPSIGDTREEQKDPEVVGKQPFKQPIIDLTNFVADLITDQNTRDEQVPGIDFFITNLGKELKARGSDVPRKDILDNALQARDIMKDGYSDLRRGVETLIEARDMLKELNDKFQPLIKENEESTGKVRDTKDQLQSVVDQMQEDKPESKGQVDTSGVKDVRDQKDDLEPLPDQLKKAAEKVNDSKNWLESAKGRVEQIELKRQKALELDKAAFERLGQSRTRGMSLTIDAEITSEKIIRNEKEWFKNTVEKALKVQEFMEKLTAPDQGFGKAIEKAKGANQATQKGKQQDEASGKEIQQAGEQINEQTQPHDIGEQMMQSGDPETQRQGQQIHDAAVQKAKEAKDKAKESQKKAEEASKKADEAGKKSKTAAEKANDQLKELIQKQLGEKSKDELTPELAQLDVDVPSPKSGPPPKGSKEGNKKNSKPVPPNFRYGVENASSGDMLNQYGEGSYGRTK